MTLVRARETLTSVDNETRAALKKAADEFRAAPAKFQAVILEAAARGENANAITEAIGFAYSPDYVRRLIRQARAEGRIPPRVKKTGN